VTARAPDGLREVTERLVADLGAAFQQRSVYAPGHPQVLGAIGRLLASLDAWWAQAGTEEVSLLLLDGQLLVDRRAFPEDAPWARGALRAFRRHALRGLTLVRGLDAAELGAFLDGCQGPGGPAPSRHLLVGQAGFAAEEGDGAGGAGGGAPPAGPFSAELLRAAGEELAEIAGGAAQGIAQLRSVVSGLVRIAGAADLDALRRAAAQVSEPELLHGLAVALGTLGLGRALRLDGRALEDLALAGLLHDVGYLDARGREEGAEARRAAHPVRGAARLAVVDGVPDVAVLVAYEHHLRLDLAPGYPVLGVPRTPNAAARVVAVADTWAALRAHAGEGAEGLSMLRARAGTFLDPVLVERFAGLVASRPSTSR